MTDAGPPVAYSTPRPEVTDLVPRRCRRVLDIGCSVGALGAALRAGGHHVVGIERDPASAALAAGRLDRVLTADVDEVVGGMVDPGGPFDCVVMADVLEHLDDPWGVMAWAGAALAPGGCVVVSVPNVRHIQLVARVVLGRRWPYDEVGIFDSTHLRWFAAGNLGDLAGAGGLHITELRRTHAIRVEPKTRLGIRANRHAALLGDFGTLQFVFRAEPVAP